MITECSYCPWFLSTQLLSLHLSFVLYECNRQTVVSCYGFVNEITQQRGVMPPVLLRFFITFVSHMLEFSLPCNITVGEAKQITMKLFLCTA
jgi:hypothetical protein